ncbi:MAG TPA: IS3 family transposase [Acidimicrobiia bacterium]|jgi:transposase InsO family protein|nr:IS3 family transposase [Acidimicrobiia bacterium]
MYSFIAEEKACTVSCWSVAEMCRVLEVSRSGFYDWESRAPSDRQLEDRVLADEIEGIWICSNRTYGSPRMHAWLRRLGYRVSRKRIARIMRQNGWAGVSGRRRVRTTIVDKTAVASSDLVARDFNPDAPDLTWTGDITYIPTGEGWLYLSTVLDLYSRRVIGWGLADHLRTGLVSTALNMAVATRGGAVDGVIFHSDRGCQYTSGEYRELCSELGVTQSMGATGICFDNSPSEAFFASLKKELVHRFRFATRAEAKRVIITWIEGWYNARRLHSTLGYLTPNEKEATYWHNQQQAA